MLKRIYTRSAHTKAVFLDRDGVINERVPDGYVVTWEQFRFRSGAFEALAQLTMRGLPLVVISNQSCISRSLVGSSAVSSIMDSMSTALAMAGVALAGWYCCPHTPNEGCLCRKPMPGMILEAAADLAINLADSYLIGDKQSDLDAGLAAGCRISFEVDEQNPEALRQAVTAICEDLNALR